MATREPPAGLLRFSIRNSGASPPRACARSAATPPFSQPRWCISPISSWPKSRPSGRPLLGGRMRRRVSGERWQLVFGIFEAAAPLAGPQREAYVHAAAPDQEVSDRVLAMLDEIRATPDGDGFPERSSSNYLAAESPAINLPNGTSLGRFVITGFVGQGGMGKVYSAHDPDLNREVRLKVMRPRAEPPAEQFIREAQAASALNHPNIVTVYEVIRSGPTVAIGMELVTGTSLRHHCCMAQPVEKLALWGRQIAHALGEAHARGIVHRDIKPENLMLRPDRYIKV